MAAVVLTATAREGLDALPMRIHGRVLNILERLTGWPDVSGARPLRGNLKGRFRVRTGNYRVQFYFREPDTVVVEKIGHRDGFYEDD
jgi:mRNA-degrading endonuclease RelE of RelBE toxin-antitoxin system